MYMMDEGEKEIPPFFFVLGFGFDLSPEASERASRS